MFNSMKEIHAAVRTMTKEELEQMVVAAGNLLDEGVIGQDQAIEIVSVAIAHMLERSLKAQVVEV
jgi:ATP-dependent protease Clp ATPase subunit